MVVVDDIREEFFNYIVHKRVLVLVSTDVDSVCAWKILQTLMKNKHVRYSIIPVETKDDLLAAYRENSQDINVVLLLNCGANFDILDFLEVEDTDPTVFFVCDNHRPVNVNNFYNQTQVRLLSHQEDFDNVPAFDTLFRDDESDDDDDDDEEGGKRRRFDESYVERRIEKRNWRRKRQELLLEYEECSHRTTSSALLLFDLAWKTSLDSTELLWLAVVGHTSLFVTHAVNREHYMESVDYLQSQVARLARSGGRHSLGPSGDENTPPVASVRLSFEEEVLLNLHRHWSLRDAVKNSLVTSSAFKLFTLKGQKRLQEFLAHAGVPQRQFEEKFSSMDVKLRTNLPSLFAQHGEKFGLVHRDLFLPSFLANSGYRVRLSAIDAALVCVAVLEDASGGASLSSNFRNACDVLINSDTVDNGIERAQHMLRFFNQHVQQFLDTDEINVFKAFLYIHVAANSPLVSACLNRPLSMAMLARLALHTKASVRPNLGRNKKTNQLPLLLCIDAPGEDGADQVTVMGVPPLQGDDDRNVFGQAFESAAQTTKIKVKFRFFDTNILQVRRDDLLKLFEALASLLS